MTKRAERPLKTLIVDRSEAFLAGAARFIADRAELEVVGTAASGPEALEAVERLDPDLVVVEAVLPGLDGFRVVRALKARPRPPLAVLTTFLASGTAEDAAFAAGADGFVAKDDFAGAFELLLRELLDERLETGGPLRGRERSARPGSRTEPGP